MLIQFRFKNFKSFRDDAILDMSATKITEYSNTLTNIGGEKLLPTAAVLGANASGKSNVIEAFRYMVTYVINSFGYGGEEGARKAKRTPFMFDGHSRNQEMLFEVYFVDNQTTEEKSYNYGFTLAEDSILEEWLNVKAKTSRRYKTVFYRDKDILDLGGLNKKSQELIKISLNKETLILSLGSKLKVQKLLAVRNWFANTRVADFGNPIENFFLSSLLPAGFAHSRSVQQDVVSYLASFDDSITGFETEIVSDEKRGEEDTIVKVDAVHKLPDGNTVSIPLQDESQGTLKMIALYPALQDVLSTGGVLFVDELNARLHPLLVRNIIITFKNIESNPKHAQLVFTTHDSWQISNDLLRRDEIWFTEKNTEGVSTLYSLAEFVSNDGNKIRKDESIGKNYMLGKYGAIPILHSLNIRTSESEEALD